MSELLDAVRDRPLDEKPSDAASCPFCGEANLRTRDVWTTLLGGGDGTLDGDPNHRHEAHWCRACRSEFFRETKSGNVWYTERDGPTRTGHLLRGVPSCFEDYTYHCAVCEGRVRRRYTEMDGTTPLRGSLMYSFDGQQHQRVFWTCDTCNASTETREDHWRPRIP